jgi:hypothetical protein
VTGGRQVSRFARPEALSVRETAILTNHGNLRAVTCSLEVYNSRPTTHIGCVEPRAFIALEALGTAAR